MLKSVRELLVAPIARVQTLISDFRSDRRGNVAIIVAIASIPMISAIGCVIDFTTASMIRTKLQAAADAATLAAASVNSSSIATAQSMTTNGAVSGGATLVTGFFNGNLTQSPENVGYTSLSSTGTMTKTGQVVAVTLTFSAQVPTFFMGIMGYHNIPVSGSSTASYTLPTYINFYLMIDVSGSMAFPSTAAEQARLMAVNPDNLNGSNGYPGGCTFACHFTAQGVCSQSTSSNPYQGPYPAAGTTTNPGSGGYCQGFIISRLGTTPVSFTAGTNNTTNGNNVNWSNTQVTSCPTAGTTSCIQLRADAVGYAVNELLITAYNTEQSTGISNQFQIGLYPFIENLYAYVPLTANISSSSTIFSSAQQLATLLDTGQNSNLGSGGTHFENAFPSINNLITSVGTGGSSTNALPYVFLITDGVENSQTYPPFNGSNPTALDTSLCTTLKNRGITIAVLYIPYQPIQNPNANFAGDEDGKVNAIIPPNSNEVPNNLQSCASPNFFYTANTPADIDFMLVTMFEQAVSTAHITN